MKGKEVNDRRIVIGNESDVAHDLKTNYLYFKKLVYQQAYGKDGLLQSRCKAKVI